MVGAAANAGLKKHDMVTRKHDQPRGILHRNPEQAWRYSPSADLAPYVEHYWTVEWDLPAPQLVETLPHPSVHIILEPGVAQIAGVHTAKFSRWLEGKSRVLGVKFRPGGFRPFVKQPVSAFTDRILPLQETFGDAAQGLERRVLAHAGHEAAIAVVESFLREFQAVSDPSALLADRIVAHIAADKEMTKVEQIGQEFGMGVRMIQRLFGEYVGVSPKWVIQRYRLHEAVAQIASATTVDWVDFALNLGYADQAHFIRDFKKLVGKSPANYLKAMTQNR